MGAGKSTFLNKILGKDKFETSDSAKACTTRHAIAYCPEAKLWILDLPGYGDLDITEKQWLKIVREGF